MFKNLLKALGILIVITIGLIAFITYNTISQHKKLTDGEFNMNVQCDTIPFTYATSGHILVKANINGGAQKHKFILDSGASNFLFSHFTQNHQIENNGFGIGIGISENFFFTSIKKVNSLNLGHLEFKEFNAKIVNYPLSCDEDIAGIIGTGLMQNLIWQINFEKQIIIIAQKEEDLQFNKNRIEIPLVQGKYGNKLYGQLRLRKDKSLKDFIIDIGSNSIITIKEELLLQDSLCLPSKNIYGAAAKGLGEQSKQINYAYHLANEIQFKGTTKCFKKVPIGTATKSLNTIGLRFFKHFKTTLNWPDKKLVLEPKNIPLNFIWKSAGFSVKYNPNLRRSEIATVVENTPASIAGLEVGTEIVSVNGKNLNDKSAACNHRAIQEKVDTTTIIIKLEGQTKEVTLVKEFLF